MSVLPQTRIEQVEFCESHWPLWESSYAEIGVTQQMATVLKGMTSSARAKYDAAILARQASRAATQEFYDACSDMRQQAAMMIAAIKSYADQQSNPGTVYATAQIPPPAAPTPATAPGKPSNFTITLEPTGAVTLTWDAENSAASSGAFFSVARKLPGTGSFIAVGGAPGSTASNRRMSFTDENIPSSAAATGVQYVVTGRRGTLVGTPSDAVTVQFGTDGLGTFSINGQATAIKMAA